METTEQSADTHLKGSHQCYCHSLLRWSLADIHTGNCLEYYGTEHDFCRALRDIHQYPLYISPLKQGDSRSKTPHKQRSKGSMSILLSTESTVCSPSHYLPSQGHTGRCSLQSQEILGKFPSSHKDQGNKEQPLPGSSHLESRRGKTRRVCC